MLVSVMARRSQTLLVDRLAVFLDDYAPAGHYCLARSRGLRISESDCHALDLSFLSSHRELARGYLFYDSARPAREESEAARRTLEQLDLHYFIPCRIHDRTLVVLGLGNTIDGNFFTTQDVYL